MLKPLSDENWNGVPIEECPAVTDVIVEGVERMEILGEYGRLVYWHWRYRGGQWERAVVDVAIVRPMSSFAGPIEAWCPRVVRVPRINLARRRRRSRRRATRGEWSVMRPDRHRVLPRAVQVAPGNRAMA